LKSNIISLGIFLVLFTGAIYLILGADAERLAFDGAAKTTDTFLRTTCHMGELCSASLELFISSLPQNGGPYELSITCKRYGKEEGETLILHEEITDMIEKSGTCLFTPGDILCVKLKSPDRMYDGVCVVNGVRSVGSRI